MGYLSLTVITSFTFLLAYSFLIHGAQAKLVTSSEQTSLTNNNEIQQKRPSVWQLKAYPIRRLKPLGLYRKDFSSDIEFDDVIGEMDKRFDDYGHMRFGKRGVGEDGFDDYGHMRFGR